MHVRNHAPVITSEQPISSVNFVPRTAVSAARHGLQRGLRAFSGHGDRRECCGPVGFTKDIKLSSEYVFMFV